MSDASKIPEAVRLLAERHGLAKALKLFPDGVKAAAERGLKPLGELPEGHDVDQLASAHLQSRPLRARQMTDLAYLTVAEGAELLRTKKLSPVEWTKALLDRIAAIDSTLQRVPRRHRRQGAGASEGRRSRNRQGPMARTDARRALRRQGHLRHRRHGDHLPFQDPQGPSRHIRRVCGEKAARGRRGAARQGRAARVRDRRAGVRPALAAGAQPVEPRPASRRLVERLGRGARGRHGAGRARHRHRRLGAQSRDLLRHRRHEADLRRGEPGRRVSADLFARPRRADDAHGRGQRDPLPCHRRPRSRTIRPRRNARRRTA